MAITIQDCEEHLIHELGGRPSSDVRTIWLINQAGLHMLSMHSWRYLSQLTDGTAGNTIDFVSGQSYADLPSDFAEFIGLERSNGLVNGFQLTSFQDIIDMRTGAYPNTAFKTYGALYWTNDSAGIPVQRLALHPTPTANQTNAVVMAYRKGWQVPADRDDKSYLQMPPYMELLYISILRGVAMALEFKRTTVTQVLDEIRTSSMFMAAVERDASQQREIGPLRNGAMGSDVTLYSLYPAGLTSDPS